MGQNGYNQSPTHYYANKSYYGDAPQRVPSNNYRSQVSSATNSEPPHPSYQAGNNHAPATQAQASVSPSHMEYSRRQTSYQGQGSNQNQSSYQISGSNSKSERDLGRQPYQTLHPVADTSALRHLAHTSTLRETAVAPTATELGQGTGSLHQIIDYNRTHTHISAQYSDDIGRPEPLIERRSQDPSMKLNQNERTVNGSLHMADPPASYPEQPSKINTPRNYSDGLGSGQQPSIYQPPSTNRDRGLSGAVHQATQASPQKTILPPLSDWPSSTDPTTRAVPQSPALPRQTPISTSAAQDHRNESAIPQHPAIVKSSQMLNQEEYAITQARSKAEKSNAHRQVTPAGKGDDDGRRKEQIEADMKAMIRKMQEYKSKDPGLFSQIWEQVKTGQAPIRALPQVRPQTESILSPDLQQGTTAVRSSSSAQKSPYFPKDDASPAQPPSQKSKRASTAEDQTDVKRRKSDNFEITDGFGTVIGPQKLAPVSQSIELPTAQKVDQRKTVEKLPWQSRPTSIIRNSTPTQAIGRQSVTPSTGPTLWPNGHRGFNIAVALRQYLINTSGNHGKEITVEDIQLLLSGNPTFPKLCDILSGRGFVIDRSACARYLLEATPELQRGQAPEQATQTNGQQPPETNGTGIKHVQLEPNENIPPGHPARIASRSYYQPYTALVDNRPPPPLGQSMALDLSRLHRHSTPVAPIFRAVPKASKPSAKGMVAGVGKLVKSKPPTKAELARKQSFGDIVDLTAASDDDEFEIARAKAQQEAEELGKSKLKEKQQIEDETMPMAAALSSGGEPTELTKVVEQIQRHNALQKSAYNSQTIARDILLATGKHPSMAPLNDHLAGLRTRFRDVDFTSDLSTFKWDAVDPGGPDHNDADSEDDPAKSHTDSPRMQPLVVDQGAVVGTGVRAARAPRQGRRPKTMISDQHIRQRLGPRTEPRPEPGPEAPSNNGRIGSQSRADAIESAGAGTTPVAGSQNQMQDLSRLDVGVLGGGSALSFTRAAGVDHDLSNTPIVRRGRPPGSGRKQDKQRGVEVAIRPNPAVNRASPFSTPRGSSLRNEVTLSSPSIAVMVPPPSADPSLYKPQARRGRPRKISPSSHQQSTPKYAAYECHWRECPAKLHNLDILKRHALKHSNEYKPGPFPCLWEGCPIRSDGETSENNTFGDIHSWEQHMNCEHFSLVASRLGDGPRATPSSDHSDHYLSDSHGRQVTPLATPQQGLPDPVSLNAEPKTTKAYHAAHENDTEEERASAIYQAHLGRRRKVGPGVLRTGASFVNEKKRKLLEMHENDVEFRDAGPTND